MLNRLHRWLARPHVRTPLVIGAVSRLVIFLVAFLGVQMFGVKKPHRSMLHGGAPHANSLLQTFQRFDAYWFLNVANNGYQVKSHKTPRVETNISAFPLYPVAMKLVSVATRDLNLAGTLISLVCFFGVLFLLYREVSDDHDEETATRAILYLSVFPTSWFYQAVYAEALLLLLALLSLRMARMDRPIASGLFGMGASLTRLAGGLLALPVLCEFTFGGGNRVRPQRLVRGLLPAVLITTGWLAYFSYISALTNRFWFYFTAHRSYSSLVEPWTSLWKLVAPGLLKSPERLVALIIVAIFLAAAVWAARRMRLGHSMYLATGILFCLSSPNLMGLPRYLMVLFPVYIVLARWARSPARHLTLVVGFCMVHGALLMAWLQWKFNF